MGITGDDAAEISNGRRQSRAPVASEMMALGVAAHEEDNPQISQGLSDSRLPEACTFPAWRAVGAVCIEARKTKAHRRERENPLVVERVPVDAEPIPEAVTGWIVERQARGVDAGARGLADHQNAGSMVEPCDRPRLVRQGRAYRGVAADTAGADLSQQCRDLLRRRWPSRCPHTATSHLRHSTIFSPSYASITRGAEISLCRFNISGPMWVKTTSFASMAGRFRSITRQSI